MIFGPLIIVIVFLTDVKILVVYVYAVIYIFES